MEKEQNLNQKDKTTKPSDEDNEFQKQSDINKEKVLEPIKCECGCIVTRSHLPRHKRSAKHQQLMTEYI